MPTLPSSRQLIAFLAIAGLMLAAHPYWGLWHDGTLYFGQVLLHSRVPQLAQDLFFASGSQDRYSVYAHVVGPLYALIGQPATHLTGVLCSWTLMAAGVLALLRPLQPQPLAGLWGMLAFAVITPIYGGGWVFSYGEQFLTARSFAEPLLLWSLVALLRGRLGLMAVLLVAAGAFHPLMTLPVLAVIWCYGLQANRRWLWALAVLPLVAAAGAAGMAPWDGLLRRYDPYWWSLIDTVSPQVLPTNWSALEAFTVVLDLAVLAAAARALPQDPFTRLLHATVLATALLMAACLVLADGLHLVLPTQLQLWRVHWVTHLLSVILTPWLVARLWSRGGLWPVSACALVLALVNVHVNSPHGGGAVLLAGAACALAARVRQVSRATRWLACTCLAIGIVATSATRLATLLQLESWQFPEAGWAGLFLLAVSFPIVAMPGFAGLLALHDRGGRAGRAAAWLLSTALFATVALHWDQRTDLARATESSDTAPPPFAAELPRDTTVYWPGSLAPVWGLLERANHFALQQGSGMLFHRHNALSFGERRETYRGISEDYGKCRTGAMLANDRQALQDCDIPSLDRLAALCAAPDHPGFIVLPARQQLAPLATWQLPVHREPPQTFSLYACSQLAPPP